MEHIASGKVREIYEVDDESLFIVTTDRISAFDVILNELIPDKGRVLNGVSAFWFDQTKHLVPNHVISCDPIDFPGDAPVDSEGRAMLVRKAPTIQMECIVRGYLHGAGWLEYTEQGTLNGLRMPKDMQQAQKLPEPVFTPSSKAEAGHDLPLTYEQGVEIVGEARYKELSDLSIELYKYGAAHAKNRGIILADTKFEFGVTTSGELLVTDEMMTPDSSRYWPADEYIVGTSPSSFDKQYVRDFLLSVPNWDHTPPAPKLPDEVVAGTRSRYVEAYERITDQPFGNWYGVVR